MGPHNALKIVPDATPLPLPSRDGSGPRQRSGPPAPSKRNADGSGSRPTARSSATTPLNAYGTLNEEDFVLIEHKTIPPASYAKIMEDLGPQAQAAVTKIAQAVRTVEQRVLAEVHDKGRRHEVALDEKAESARAMYALAEDLCSTAAAKATAANHEATDLLNKTSTLAEEVAKSNKTATDLAQRILAGELTAKNLVDILSTKEANMAERAKMLNATYDKLMDANDIVKKVDDFTKNVVRVRLTEASSTLFKCMTWFVIVLIVAGLLIRAGGYSISHFDDIWSVIKSFTTFASSEEPSEEVQKMVENTSATLTSDVIDVERSSDKKAVAPKQSPAMPKQTPQATATSDADIPRLKPGEESICINASKNGLSTIKNGERLYKQASGRERWCRSTEINAAGKLCGCPSLPEP